MNQDGAGRGEEGERRRGPRCWNYLELVFPAELGFNRPLPGSPQQSGHPQQQRLEQLPGPSEPQEQRHGKCRCAGSRSGQSHVSQHEVLGLFLGWSLLLRHPETRRVPYRHHRCHPKHTTATHFSPLSWQKPQREVSLPVDQFPPD